jgi:hypothetical protein
MRKKLPDDFELDDYFKRQFPYCLERQSNGTYLALNREYKPITYADSKKRNADGTLNLTIDEETAAKLSYNGSRDLGKIWLYDQVTDPQKDRDNYRTYMEKWIKLLGILT